MAELGGPRIRRAGVPVDAVLVVRGDVLDAELLRKDAARFRRRFAAWDRYGLSAFHAANDAEVAALCEARLVQFAEVVVFRRGDLEAAGVEVAATFRTPHVTLAAAELEELVASLLSCEHQVRANPYHVAEDQEPG